MIMSRNEYTMAEPFQLRTLSLNHPSGEPPYLHPTHEHIIYVSLTLFIIITSS